MHVNAQKSTKAQSHTAASGDQLITAGPDFDFCLEFCVREGLKKHLQ